MSSSSSFAQLDGPEHTGWRGWKSSFIGALDGASSNIPLSLGCVTLVFSHVAPDLLANGVFATMLALAFIHLATARGQRPFLFSARIFEATALVAMMDQVVVQLPAWGLPDTVGVRLAFLCLIGAGGGLAVGALYLLRAHRFTPLIPAPVFAGFANSIAVALLISQTASLWHLFEKAAFLPAIVTVVVVSFGTAFVVRRWHPAWPSSAAGMAAGLAAGLMWLAAGQATPMVSASGWSLTLPIVLADFGAFAAPAVRLWPVTLAILGNAAILGIMMFINTTMTSQTLTQADGRRPKGAKDAIVTTLGLVGAGLAGSAPVSGGMLASLAVTRTTVMRPLVMSQSALIITAVYLSGILGWIPLAAVCSTLLCEAWYMADRDSLRSLANWLRRRAMPHNEREDLALIGAVTATAVLVNMVAAVFAGLLLGLVLFAARSARRPVRHVWTGAQLSSNCARSRGDLRVLAQHGGMIRVFELEGDLFFGAAESLERSLQDGSHGASCVVIDWLRVRHVDTSLALAVGKFERFARERGILPVHAGADMHDGNVGAELLRRMPEARFTHDLDHALEIAENQVIQLRGEEMPADATTLLDAMTLFKGMDAQERVRIEQAMPQKFFASGEVMVTAGDPGDELMLVLHGSASILVRTADGKHMRIAGVRRGAMIGEIGFLDGSSRSATVVAQEDVTVAVLGREAYDELSRTSPHLVQQLLANIALEIATRLRHNNQVAMARNRHR